MNNLTIAILAILLLSSCDDNPTWEVAISNPSDHNLTDVPITLTRSELEENLGKISGEDLIVTHGDHVLPFQLDDLDGDGSWEQLLTLMDLSEGQKTAVSVKKGDQKNPMKMTPRTNIRMARRTSNPDEFELVDHAIRIRGTDTKVTSKHFQYEGPGWENDRIAFRNYFDERNGMDIFGKTTAEMILHKVGVGASYHELQDWGMDILKVGNSLGSGAIALLYEDSLYRVTAPQGGSYQLVKAGALRSIFDLDFTEVLLGTHKVGVKHRIIITAGVYGYESQVFLEGERRGIQVVSGLVNMQSKEAHLLESGKMNILYTYDRQAFDGEKLGMALMSSDQYYRRWFETPEEGSGITQTYAMVCEADGNGMVSLFFLAGWELSDQRFRSKAGFENYLREEAIRQALDKI